MRVLILPKVVYSLFFKIPCLLTAAEYLIDSCVKMMKEILVKIKIIINDVFIRAYLQII